jgi:chemotaxis protein CheD
MRIVVNVSDMKLSNKPGDIIVTHALGSCVGIAIHDAEACVGGMIHYMLPKSNIDVKKAEQNPFMFADTGVPLFFQKAYALGAKKESLRVVMAGGSNLFAENDMFSIGTRNVIMARKLLWKNSIIIDKEDVGGNISRTFYLEIGSGITWLTSGGTRIDL